jgi:hypothetical protein
MACMCMCWELEYYQSTPIRPDTFSMTPMPRIAAPWCNQNCSHVHEEREGISKHTQHTSPDDCCVEFLVLLSTQDKNPHTCLSQPHGGYCLQEARAFGFGVPTSVCAKVDANPISVTVLGAYGPPTPPWGIRNILRAKP